MRDNKWGHDPKFSQNCRFDSKLYPMHLSDTGLLTQVPKSPI